MRYTHVATNTCHLTDAENVLSEVQIGLSTMDDAAEDESQEQHSDRVSPESEETQPIANGLSRPARIQSELKSE